MGLLQCVTVPGLQAGGSDSLLSTLTSRLPLALLEVFNSVEIYGNELLTIQSNENQLGGVNPCFIQRNLSHLQLYTL